MISVNGIEIKPTIFPDGTSQVWKLPREILLSTFHKVLWRFENERELIDLVNYRLICPHTDAVLHMPFLPYARQDKQVSNESTFGLETFADMINGLHFRVVTAVDVHNPKRSADLIDNFYNIDVSAQQFDAIKDFEADWICFPDEGAYARYGLICSLQQRIICEKVRDQSTGEITGMKHRAFDDTYVADDARVLVIDDICDGGATFVKIGQMFAGRKLGLFVTHGIFSQGVQRLYKSGYEKLYTTDSFTKRGLTDGCDETKNWKEYEL